MFNRVKKEKKPKFIDNGETIADMNVKGLPWYRSKKEISVAKRMAGVNLLPHERRAIILGAMFAYMPVFLVMIAGFTVVYLLFLLWASNV